MAPHSIKVSLLDSGNVQLTDADGASIEVPRADIGQLTTDMVIACIPDDVRESAMQLYCNNREAVAFSFISPAPALDDATPMSKCATEEGRKALCQMYDAIYHGVYL